MLQFVVFRHLSQPYCLCQCTGDIFYEVEHSCHYKKKVNTAAFDIGILGENALNSLKCFAMHIFVLYLQVLTRKFMFNNICTSVMCVGENDCATVSPSYIHFSLVEYIKQSILLKIFYQQYSLTV